MEKSFYTIKEAKIIIEQWRKQYNTERPHSSLNYEVPVPQSYLFNERKQVAISNLNSGYPIGERSDKNEAAANAPVASPEEIEENTSDSLAETTDAPTEMPETEAGVDEGDATASPETETYP